IGLVHWEKGLWNAKGGYEFPLTLLAIGATIGLVGPGRYSLDALLGLAPPTTLVFWVGLVAVLVVVGYGLFLPSRRAVSRQQHAS
ncbi:MAG TPA: DoxX family protein, partial [Roseiflexaceae bacterium]